MLACVENSVVFPFQHNYHTTEDEVTFRKLKQYYRHNETIVVEYTLGQKVRASSHDFVGMYPAGWHSLEQVIAFETALVRPAETYRRQRKVVFQPRHRVKRIQHGVEYTFVYVSQYSMQVLGTSSTFMFMSDMLPESPQESWKGCDEKVLKTGRPLRKTQDGHSLPFFMETLSANPQYSSCVMAPPWIQQPQHHHNNMGGTSSVVPVCLQCKSPANYARTQQNLQAKVRAVTDELHDEKARSAALERQLELSRAAQAKLRLSAQYANREKNLALAYLNNLIGSLSERGILKMIHQTTGPDQRQRLCTPPPVAQKVIHHPPDASNPNIVPTPRPGLLTARERLLKAIIGSQEATIRDLVRRLHVTEGETKNTKELEVQKMKVLGNCASGSSDDASIISANCEQFAKVDTVQTLVVSSQDAQFGDREVLPDSDDSDGNETSSSGNNDGVFSSK